MTSSAIHQRQRRPRTELHCAGIASAGQAASLRVRPTASRPCARIRGARAASAPPDNSDALVKHLLEQVPEGSSS
jgi:hypothetical protein